jgi:hypothetical protein
MYKHSTPSMQINQSADPLRSTYAVEQFFADYRQAYKENLAGSENAEITQQLLGKNAKRIVFIDPRCAAPQSARRPVGHPIFLPRSVGATHASALSRLRSKTLDGRRCVCRQ